MADHKKTGGLQHKDLGDLVRRHDKQQPGKTGNDGARTETPAKQPEKPPKKTTGSGGPRIE